MARAKTTRRRRRSPFRRAYRRARRMTIPMAIVGGMIPVATGLWNRRESATEMGAYLQRGFTGVEPGTNRFVFSNLRLGAIPLAAGFFVHVIASKLGFNRALGRAGLPLIRI